MTESLMEVVLLISWYLLQTNVGCSLIDLLAIVINI